MPQIFHLRLCKGALRQLENKIVVKEYLKSKFQMFQMVRERRAVNQDIVEEDDDKAAEVGPENEIHSSLKGRRGIAKPERHHFELKVAVMCPKSCLRNVAGMHAYLVVALQQVELGEALSTAQFIEKFVNRGYRKSILNCDRI